MAAFVPSPTPLSLTRLCISRRLIMGLLILLVPAPTMAQTVSPALVTALPGAPTSPDASVPSSATQTVLKWVIQSDDHSDLPFMIIDKVAAKVYMFSPAGELQGTTYALLGAAVGDESPPGIGSQKLSTIPPSERITPAGRFVAALGRDLEHDVLWIDYDDALALHRVVHGNPNDHRLERLSIQSSKDKRISYGCVNVPAKFFDDIVVPQFRGTKGIVYILPEVKTLKQVFPNISGGSA